MTVYEASTETAYQRTTRILQWALDRAINRRMVGKISVDKNTVDAFTAALMDAGVNLDALDMLLADAEPALADGY
jgi:hypothetical protein